MTPAKPLPVSDLPGHHDAGGHGGSRSAKPAHVAGTRGEQPGCFGEPQPEQPAPARLGKGRRRATRPALGWHQEGTQSFPRPPQRPQPRNGWYFLAKLTPALRKASGSRARRRGTRLRLCRADLPAPRRNVASRGAADGRSWVCTGASLPLPLWDRRTSPTKNWVSQ